MARGDSTGGVDWDTDGTDYTPMVVKIRKYGYQPFLTSWDGRSSLTTLNIFMVDDNVVVANETTAGAYTGITVDGSTETITISADHTMQEIYDYVQWWSAQSTNVQYVVPMESADGNTFIIAEDWRLICNGGSITSGTGKTLAFSGTGYLQLDGETADNIAVNSGDVYLESATNLTGMTITDDLRIDTGANSTLTFDAMVISGNVWNDDASHTLTINATNGSSMTAGDPGVGNGQTNVINAVTLTITVTDINGAVIENARVLLEANTGGPAPSGDTVTITRSGTTASVSHTAHGMSNGDKVVIRDANEEDYNGVFTISNVTTNGYDYTVSGSPTTPATGTIKATQVFISKLTNASGIATESINYSSDQPCKGVVRKSSSSPFYQQGVISGTITSGGFSATILLISDE
jgi:hypothetical protein